MAPVARGATRARPTVSQLELSPAGAPQHEFPSDSMELEPSSPAADVVSFRGYDTERSVTREPSSDFYAWRPQGYDTEASVRKAASLRSTSYDLEKSMSPEHEDPRNVLDSQATRPLPRLNNVDVSNANLTSGLNSRKPTSKYVPATDPPLPASSEIGGVEPLMSDDEDQQVNEPDPPKVSQSSKGAKGRVFGHDIDLDDDEDDAEPTIVVSDDISLSEDNVARSDGESSYCPSEKEVQKPQKRRATSPPPKKPVRKPSVGTLLCQKNERTQSATQQASQVKPCADQKSFKKSVVAAQSRSQVPSASQKQDETAPAKAFPKKTPGKEVAPKPSSSRWVDEEDTVVPDTQPSGKKNEKRPTSTVKRVPKKSFFNKESVGHGGEIQMKKAASQKKSVNKAVTLTQVAGKRASQMKGAENLGSWDELELSEAHHVVDWDIKPSPDSNKADTHSNARSLKGTLSKPSTARRSSQPSLGNKRPGNADVWELDDSPAPAVKRPNAKKTKTGANTVTTEMEVSPPAVGKEVRSTMAPKNATTSNSKKKRTPAQYGVNKKNTRSTNKPATKDKPESKLKPGSNNKESGPEEELLARSKLASKNEQSSVENPRPRPKADSKKQPPDDEEPISKPKLASKKGPLPKEKSRPDIVHFGPRGVSAEPEPEFPVMENDDVFAEFVEEFDPLAEHVDRPVPEDDESASDFQPTARPSKMDAQKQSKDRPGKHPVDIESHLESQLNSVSPERGFERNPLMCERQTKDQNSTVESRLNLDSTMSEMQEEQSGSKLSNSEQLMDGQDLSSELQEESPLVEDPLPRDRKKRAGANGQEMMPAAKKTRFATSAKTPARPVTEQLPPSPHVQRHITISDSGSPIVAGSDATIPRFQPNDTDILRRKALKKTSKLGIDSGFNLHDEDKPVTAQWVELAHQSKISGVKENKHGQSQRLTQSDTKPSSLVLRKSSGDRSPFVAGGQAQNAAVLRLKTGTHQQSPWRVSKPLSTDLAYRKPMEDISQSQIGSDRINSFQLQKANFQPTDLHEKPSLAMREDARSIPSRFENSPPSARPYQSSDDPFRLVQHDPAPKGISFMRRLEEDPQPQDKSDSAPNFHPRSQAFTQALAKDDFFASSKGQSDKNNHGRGLQAHRPFKRSQLSKHYEPAESLAADGFFSTRGTSSARGLRHGGESYPQEKRQPDKHERWQNAVDLASKGVADVVHMITTTVLRQLTSKEAAIASVVDEYTRNGGNMVGKLIKRQKQERETTFGNFQQNCRQLSSTYNDASKATKIIGDELSSKTFRFSQANHDRQHEFDEIRRAINAAKEAYLGF